jgi:hypothetical protein
LLRQRAPGSRAGLDRPEAYIRWIIVNEYLSGGAVGAWCRQG